MTIILGGQSTKKPASGDWPSGNDQLGYDCQMRHLAVLNWPSDWKSRIDCGAIVKKHIGLGIPMTSSASVTPKRELSKGLRTGPYDEKMLEYKTWLEQQVNGFIEGDTGDV
ncbi:hypothetical protein [Polycladomyces subterraneus]|uniref:Uncharacterized protein n=1 Tax=Polycladomyces subterraneus TaxID=1016997 RepID=A0ABT8IPX7_9BACL|nr:hypothetical protein [Polycladomyces subterraneus]MDN4594860.1 hypothetical protein [Polycladomyces subterraneus]